MAGNRYTPEQIADALAKYHAWSDSPWSPEKPTVEQFCRDVLGISKPTLYKWVREDRLKRELESSTNGHSPLTDATIAKFVTDLAAVEARNKTLQRKVEELERRLTALEAPPATVTPVKRRSPGTGGRTTRAKR